MAPLPCPPVPSSPPGVPGPAQSPSRGVCSALFPSPQGSRCGMGFPPGLQSVVLPRDREFRSRSSPLPFPRQRQAGGCVSSRLKRLTLTIYLFEGLFSAAQQPLMPGSGQGLRRCHVRVAVPGIHFPPLQGPRLGCFFVPWRFFFFQMAKSATKENLGDGSEGTLCPLKCIALSNV